MDILLENVILEGLTYLTGLRTATSEIESNNSYAREADDRDVWRSMIGNVLQEQATDK